MRPKYPHGILILPAILQILTSIKPATGVLPNHQSEEDFSREHFGVYFDMPVYLNGDVKGGPKYTESEIFQMLDTVSVRFSKLIVPSLAIPDVQANESHPKSRIPIVAAQLNVRNAQSSIWNVSKNTSIKPYPVELYMGYEIQLTSDRTGSSADILLTSFHSVKTIADVANGLFKHTVKYLFTFVYGKLLKRNNIDALTRHLASVKQINADSDNKYKIGVRVDIYFCGESSSHIQTFLNKILPLLDFIIFQPYLDTEGFSCGVSTALHCTQMKMKKCRGKLSKLRPHLEVLFSTGWARQAGNSRETDISNMVHFWDKMNAWAAVSNITVFMAPVFDNPHQKGLGWWQMEKNLTSNTTYTFLEQFTSIPFHPTNISTTSTILTNKCLEPMKFDQQNGNNSAVVERNLNFSSTHFGVFYIPLIKDTDNLNTYDEVDLVPFIETISTRFTNILIPVIDEEYLEEHGFKSFLLNAVAMCNKKNSGKSHQHVVQVFMSYRLEPEKDIYRNHFENKPLYFDVAKQAADKANLVYPGTVRYLLLQEFGLNEAKVENLLEQLNYVKRQKGNFTYNLGLTLGFTVCYATGILNTNTQLVTPLIQQVTMVVLEMPWNIQDYIIGVEAMFEKWTTLFSLCSDLLKSINPEVQVAFITFRPDTDARGKRNITAFTWFWREMNKWAIKTDNFVFMKNAFNVPRSIVTEPTFRTTGWWKFVKDRACYKNTGEYTFVEKVLEEDLPRTNIGDRNPDHTTRWNNTLENVHFADKTNLSLENKLNISRNLFGVYLHPFVNKDASSNMYSEEDVKILLSIVQTRFSKIFMMPVNEISRAVRDSQVHIPKAAAKMNKAGTGAEPLQVFVSFTFDPLKSSDEALRGSIDLALELADEANDIFVNTVPSILLFHEIPLTNSNRWKAAEVLVKYFQQRAHQKTHRTLSTAYEAAAVLKWKYCESEEYFAVAKQYLLPYLDFVVVAAFTTPELVKLGVEKSFNQVIRAFDYCKAKITQSFPHLKVGLFSGWVDESTRGKNHFNLVLYWRKMNDYAVANDTQVFLRDAFDRPDFEDYTGWWGLVEESNLNGSGARYVFQEKYQMLSQSFNDNEGPASSKDDMQFSYFKVAVVTSTAGFGVVIIMAVLGALVIRKYRREALAAKQRLSEGEMEEFFQGLRNAGGEEIGEEGENDFEHATSLVKRFAYDTSLEVSQQAFVIDESLKLGSGTYGTVCMARFCKDGNEFSAAVKRVKPGASPEMAVCSLRSLLSEVKVLSFLGQHENIVRLLAVYTGDIRNGDICVFLEPCVLGSLKKHLGTICKDTKGTGNDDYLDLFQEEVPMPNKSNVEMDAEVSQLMFQWSLQIAHGMEYLASKKVVHADLATRNVLLDRNKVAKICDFGLSRKMYNNESYFKSKQEPLPWRWLPPESLRRWEFNELSDVWAYGVTLWEIYTLGEVPYAGLEWDQGFFCRLEEGLCPREPMHEPPGKYNEREMYRKVMLKCWEKESNSRPIFSEIVSLLMNENFG